MANTTGYEMNWDDQIVNDSPEFITLPEGEYDFEVVEFERGRHTPSPNGKLPPCNKAILHLRIESEEGITTIKHNLFLHSSVEGLLCAFFTAIGQRKKGERITMNWGSVVGSRGRAKIGIRKWKNDDGEERTINEVKSFCEPAEVSSAPQQTKFEAGRF